METLKRYPPRPNVITNSSSNRARACERRWYLRDVMGLVSRYDDAAMGLGSAFHVGLEHQSAERASAAMRASVRMPMPDGFLDEVLEERCIVVEVMVEAALARWNSWPTRREVPFRVPVMSPRNRPSRTYDLAGVVDGWPDDDAGFWHDKVGEWKTTSRLSADYLLALQVASQPSTYCWASSAILGRPIRTVVYRIAQTPTIRRRTKKQPETLEEYRSRLQDYYRARPELLFEEHITRTDGQLQEWREETFEVSRRCNAIRTGRRFPLMNDASCVAPGRRRCTYLDLCAGSLTQDAFEITDDPHPEITAAMAAEGEQQ